jgi:Rieske Fe-S protein
MISFSCKWSEFEISSLKEERYINKMEHTFNIFRREFLSSSAKTGLCVLCGSALTTLLSSCNPIDQGEPVLDLSDYSELQKPGGAIKKRYKKLNNSNPILIIRLDENTFAAYSAICTHQAVEVRLPEDGEILCPNHDSTFRITDGRVIQGDAIEPLPKFTAHFDVKTNILRIG